MIQQQTETDNAIVGQIATSPNLIANTVLALGARYNMPDARRHHIITLRLENIFDRQYATGLGTAESDINGSTYTFKNLRVPRTLEARYTYKF